MGKDSNLDGIAKGAVIGFAIPAFILFIAMLVTYPKGLGDFFSDFFTIIFNPMMFRIELATAFIGAFIGYAVDKRF